MRDYWVYIVDSPQRDLACTVWWIYESGFHKDHKVCLLPGSELSTEFLMNQKPNVIVWNYARSNNIKAIQKSKQLGIYNIIHDTEGIPYFLDKFFSGLSKSEIQLIDEVWCWGSDQANIINEK